MAAAMPVGGVSPTGAPESMDLGVVGTLILKMPRYFLPYLASANVERRGTSRTGLSSAKRRKRGTGTLGSSDPEGSRRGCARHLFFSYSSSWLRIWAYSTAGPQIAFKETLILSGLWIGVALAFNVLIFLAYRHHWFELDLAGDEPDGRTAAMFFLTGYMIEKLLGLDTISFSLP
jgi:hypothetical protein